MNTNVQFLHIRSFSSMIYCLVYWAQYITLYTETNKTIQMAFHLLTKIRTKFEFSKIYVK